SHWKRARAAAEAVYKANPNDARANYLMCRVMHAWGKLDDALKYGETAVKLNPNVGVYHKAYGEAAGEMAQKASMFKQISLAHKIKPEFDKAFAMDPKDPENVWNL